VNTAMPTSGAMYFAHAGHWLTGIAYFLPVLAFMVWLGVTQIKERRRRGETDGS
jgi:hypothetical protein